MTDTAPGQSTALRDALARPAVVLLVVVLAELALVAGYLGLTGASARSIRYLLYPFVWIDLAVWAVFAVDADASASTRARNAALAVAGVYLLVLALAGGVLDVAILTDGHVHGTEVDLTLFTSLPPGWGPTLVYESPGVTLTLVPYKIVGYLGLAYLTYAAVVDAAASVLSGAIGLLSCASCSWPVFASLAASVLGGEAVADALYTYSPLTASVLGGETVADALYTYSLDLSTAAFVVAVVLLAWRPGAGRLGAR